jgi:hypothetical protein
MADGVRGIATAEHGEGRSILIMEPELVIAFGEGE